MKHIRKYNENIEEKSIQDIKDILLELEDEGFTVNISNAIHHNVCLITISRNDDEIFGYYEVEETLLRLKDYIGDNYIGAIYTSEFEFMITPIDIPIDIDDDIPYDIKFIRVTFTTNNITGLEDME